MCIHRLFIHTVCGHSILSANPIVLCNDASIPPDGTASTSCELIAHPYQSWRLNSLCPSCACTRSRLLQRIDAEQAISYDEAKWKVSYGMPSHGLDLWGKRAAERERLEKETGKRKRRNGRFSWRRVGKKRGVNEGEIVGVAIAGSVRLDPHWLRDDRTESSHATTAAATNTH